MMIDAERILADLDRCQHGRHEGDRCFGCEGGWSVGNPHIRPGMTIGYGLDGIPIVMPPRRLKHDLANWYRKQP